MPDANETLSLLRDFLHTEAPGEDARWDLYTALKNNLESREIWLPMLKAHPRWRAEPLVWCHLDRMDGGPLRVHGPRTTSLEKFHSVFGKTPNKITIKGGARLYNHLYDPPLKEHARQCVHLRIDTPEWSFDDGQNGMGSGSADISDLLSYTWSCLRGHLGALQTFEIRTALSLRWDAMGEDGPPPRVQLRLLRKDFDLLRKMLKTRKLTRFQLSNHLPLEATWLARLPWWTSLESLDLESNSLKTKDLQWLFAAPMPALTHLNLASNRLDDAGAAALAHGGALPALEHLDLRDNKITEEGLEALRGSPSLPRLTTLLR